MCEKKVLISFKADLCNPDTLAQIKMYFLVCESEKLGFNVILDINELKKYKNLAIEKREDYLKKLFNFETGKRLK